MEILSVFVWSITSKKSRLFVICVVAPESTNHSFVDSPMPIVKQPSLIPFSESGIVTAFAPCVSTLVPALFLPSIQHNPSLNVLVFYRRNRFLFLYSDCDDCLCDYEV